jgi:hypothetical protein
MQFIKWLVTSSADPSRYSLMVKGALGMGVAYLLKALAITCSVGLYCLSLDTNVLSGAVDTIGSIVYFSLSLIGALAFLYGLGRKMWLNRWSAYQVAPADLPTA